MSLKPYQAPDLDIFGQLEANFDSHPVGIVEFAQSPDFCGRILYPRQRLLLKLFFLEELDEQDEAILDSWIHGGRNGTEIQISPDIRERMADLKGRGFKHFREVVLVGGRRCSKGFITGLALAKLVYDITQLQDPGNFYGIDKDKDIVFACVAASQDQAKQMQYSDLSAMVNSCVPLQRHIFKLQELECSIMTESDIRKLDSWKRQNRRVQKDISKIRIRALPANSRTLRGLTAMGIVFDEFAHFQQGESDQSDQSVFSAATPALAQFALDAMIFCNSSPFSKVGMLYERFEAGMAMSDGTPEYPEILSLRFPSWALYEGWWEDPTYLGPKKCITVSPDWNYDRRNDDGGLYYTEADRHAIIIARQEEKDNSVRFKVERRGMFAETIDAYLMPEMVDRMFSGRPVAYEADADMWTYESIRTNWEDSTYMNKYYAHLDPSSTTAGFGFALGHTEEFTLGQRVEKHVVFDIIKRWDPKEFPDHTIDWDPILEWVTHICDLFRPVQMTMDQFNSAYPITWLRRKFREKRIETRVYEKTATGQTNWDRAEIFRTALYRGLIHSPNDTPDCEWCANELKFLQEVKTGRIPRVEKQDTGPVQTKDLADPLHPDHEVMTRLGWKSIADITTDDWVASRDGEGRLVYDQPTTIHKRQVDEELFVHNGTMLNFAVTGNHNMLVEDKGYPELVEARHLVGVSKVPKTAIFEREGSEWMQLPGIEVPSLSRTSTAYGRCHCGCEGFTPVARRTRADRNEFKGRPVPYMPRHAARWTRDESEYLDEAYASQSMAVMTQVLDKTEGSIYGHARSRGLQRGQIGDRCNDRPDPLPRCQTRDFAAFVGFWLGDGRKIRKPQEGRGSTGYAVRITQTKPSGIVWMDNLMQRIGWPHTRKLQVNGEIEWTVKSYELREYLFALQEGEDLRLPRAAFDDWGTDALECLLDGLIASDGTQAPYSRSLFNSSRTLIDDVQCLVAHLGLYGRITPTHSEGQERIIQGKATAATRPGWRLFIGKSSHANLHATSIVREHYCGPVHCITMPQSSFLTRRHGVAMWIGNCVMTIAEVTIGDLMAAALRQDLGGEHMKIGAAGGYAIGGGGDLGSRTGSNAAMGDFYASRVADQRLPSGMRSPKSVDPARRGSGGRPVPRRLPGW